MSLQISVETTFLLDMVNSGDTAYLYDGSTQYSQVADNGGLDVNQASTDFFMTAWVEMKDITTSQYIAGKNVAGAQDGRYGLFFISSGNFQMYLQTSAGLTTISDNITAAINTRYHLATHVDISASRAYFYIDGVLQNAGGTAFTGTIGTLANDYEFYVAAGNNSGGTGTASLANEKIREVRIYHTDVTSQLSNIINNEVLGSEVSRWILGNDGSTDTAGSFDLTDINSPTTVIW